MILPYRHNYLTGRVFDLHLKHCSSVFYADEVTKTANFSHLDASR